VSERASRYFSSPPHTNFVQGIAKTQIRLEVDLERLKQQEVRLWWHRDAFMIGCVKEKLN
jgi:hypothetical protein